MSDEPLKASEKEEADITVEKQLEEWVKGNPIHCEQCCPDFSCCTPETLADKSVREKFVDLHNKGDDAGRMEMLGMFLGAAMENHGKKKVYIAGLAEQGSTH